MLSRVLLPTLLLLLLPCPATPRLKGTRPGPPHGPLRPGAICRPREGGGSAAAAAAAPWHHGCPGPALTAHPSDELHSSRGHQWGNGLVPDQMLRALLQVDGVLSARDGCQVKRPPLLCRNPRCFCGTSLFLCTTQGSARLPLLIRLWLDQDILLPLQHPQEYKGVQVGLWNYKQQIWSTSSALAYVPLQDTKLTEGWEGQQTHGQ